MVGIFVRTFGALIVHGKCLYLYVELNHGEVFIMDMDKLYKLITSDEDLKDIPLIYIMRITIAVFEIINSGECFYNIEEV